jgi:hypothetical protein
VFCRVHCMNVLTQLKKQKASQLYMTATFCFVAFSYSFLFPNQRGFESFFF